MKRANTYAYPTSGSAALKAREARFTVHEGTRSHGFQASIEQPAVEELSLLQKAKALAVIAIVLAALGATLMLSDRGLSSSFDAAFEDVARQTITVHTGDSLWDLAAEHAPEGSATADVVRWIERENGLDSALIVAGQTLVVPGV